MSNTNDVRSVGHLGWHGRTPISIFKDILVKYRSLKELPVNYSERKIFEFFLVSVQDVLFISKVLFCKSTYTKRTSIRAPALKVKPLLDDAR